MFVQRLDLADCQKAAQLHQQAFYKGWTEKDFENFLQDPLIHGFKVEENHCLYGYILWRDVEDEAEILTLVVDKACQRKGKASLLLDKMIEELRKKRTSRLFLEVAEDNKEARSFYLKHGFVFLGKRPRYYYRGENKFIPALMLYKNML